MKHLVETTGPFQLLDPFTGALVPHDRPAVVPPSTFVENRAANGHLRLLHNGLPDDAEDADFLAYWQDAQDHDLAVASYLASFEADKPVGPPPPRKVKGTREPKIAENE